MASLNDTLVGNADYKAATSLDQMLFNPANAAVIESLLGNLYKPKDGGSLKDELSKAKDFKKLADKFGTDDDKDDANEALKVARGRRHGVNPVVETVRALADSVMFGFGDTAETAARTLTSPTAWKTPFSSEYYNKLKRTLSDKRAVYSEDYPALDMFATLAPSVIPHGIINKATKGVLDAVPSDLATFAAKAKSGNAAKLIDELPSLNKASDKAMEFILKKAGDIGAGHGIKSKLGSMLTKLLGGTAVGTAVGVADTLGYSDDFEDFKSDIADSATLSGLTSFLGTGYNMSAGKLARHINEDDSKYVTRKLAELTSDGTSDIRDTLKTLGFTSTDVAKNPEFKDLERVSIADALPEAAVFVTEHLPEYPSVRKIVKESAKKFIAQSPKLSTTSLDILSNVDYHGQRSALTKALTEVGSKYDNVLEKKVSIPKKVKALLSTDLGGEFWDQVIDSVHGFSDKSIAKERFYADNMSKLLKTGDDVKVPLEWLHNYKAAFDSAVFNNGYVPKAAGSNKKSFDNIALGRVKKEARELRESLTSRADKESRDVWQSEYSNLLTKSSQLKRDENALEAGRNIFSDTSTFKDFDSVEKFYKNKDVDTLYDPPGGGLASTSEKDNFKIGIEQAIKERIQNSQKLKIDRPISPDALFSAKERAIINLAMDNNPASIKALDRRIERESRLGSSKLKMAKVNLGSEESIDSQLDRLNRGGHSYLRSHLAYGGSPLSVDSVKALMFDTLKVLNSVPGYERKKELLMETMLDTSKKNIYEQLDKVDTLLDDIRKGRDADSLALSRQLRKQVLTLNRMQELN